MAPKFRLALIAFYDLRRVLARLVWRFFVLLSRGRVQFDGTRFTVIVPKLYFAELACYNWRDDLRSMIQHLLIHFGWKMLQFELPKDERTPDGRNNPAIWADPDHPRLMKACDIIIRLIVQMKQMGLAEGSNVLILGDSTTTHCIDRQTGRKENGSYNYCYDTRHKMHTHVLDKTGVSICHNGSSGSSFEGCNNFTSWLWKSRNIATVDAILLIGGWNQSTLSATTPKQMKDYLEPILRDFTVACKDALE